MLKNKNYFFITQLILAFIFYNASAFAQRTPEQIQAEHQAVMDYLNAQHQLQPVNQNPQGPNLKKDADQTLAKTTAEEDRKYYMMNGNNILTQIWNYGGIGAGLPGDQGGSLRERLNLVWRDLSYIFQFCPLVGAEVPSALDPNQKLRIVSDGLYDYSNPGLRDEDRVTAFKWTWQPLPGFADPNQEFMASNPAFDSDRDGKPDSWPREWYNETLGEYVWPGYLRVGENNADLESYWVMDDRDNREFKYYPFENDTLRRGLGLQIDGRAFQWSNSLAANALFMVWTITNVSEKPLDKVFFGIYGDPDLGGQNDNDDDNGLFIKPFGDDVQNIPVYARSMVYFFDNPQTPTGLNGLPVYYLGCKFLESPGNPNDGIDNDGDGIIDERQDDGIDNDGDWDPETDDVGVDGIPLTLDQGEGDGIPTSGSRLDDGRPDPLAPGEPNFEYTDLDEADQIGLTSFASSSWNTDLKVGDDEVIWNRNVPNSFSEIIQDADIVFTFGSGYISLAPGESKRISMAFLFGENLSDLLTTAETVQEIYNKNYRFFRPPSLPTLTAVPGDKKVTLYWDTESESSIDPITGEDFEGYVIYRSTRPDFADIQTITDGRGSSFLYDPLKDAQGFEAKWDLTNDWKGYHPVPYQGRGVHYYLGDDSGLRHSFVDSNNVINGQTYYYAVVAYDHGDSLGIPPTETTKKISQDPITSNLIYDLNTTSVIPGPRASGYSQPSISVTDVQHVQGFANGEVDFSIINDLDVVDDKYTLTFKDTLFVDDDKILAKNYSVLGERINTESFYLFGFKNTNLQNNYIIDDDNLVVKDINGVVYQNNVDYIINYEKGTIKRDSNTTMPDNSEYTITYRNYSIYQSQYLNGEDSNPVFDGIKLKVTDYNSLAIDLERTKWADDDVQIPFSITLTPLGNRKKQYPGDYIVTFFDENSYPAKKRVPGQPLQDILVNYQVEEVSSGISIPVMTLLEERAKNDTTLSLGDEIILFLPGTAGLPADTLSWGITLSKTADGDSIVPGAGDMLLIYTTRPFTKGDVFTLNTSSGFVSNEDAKSRLDNIYVVPNPYVGTNDIEPTDKLPNQNRGERRIYFENLPMKCTIRIFTLSGELVTTIEHESGVDNGREFWNLLNRDGFSVSYGLYIAHIDAPEVGEKLIKFALIK
ncbi:MAG: hypothetical protein MUF28_04985 [Ignavibacterium sp.]|nr:hypothetical protein [Ignavibacterium sp.]